MVRKKKTRSVEELLSELTEAIRDLTIVQLGLAGVRQQQIREIVKTDIVRVNDIVKRLKKAGDIKPKKNKIPREAATYDSAPS